MQAFLKTIFNSISTFFIFVLVFIILLPSMPLFHKIPLRDSSIFLYIGTHILQGEIPYRDIWDHKGPLIYYINALGLILGNGSRWGLWVIEVVSLLVSTIFLYLIIKKYFGRFSAIASSIAFLISICSVIDFGNYTEEFALPFQAGILYLFLRKKIVNKREIFLVGILSACLFLLRPNLIGITIAIIIYQGVAFIQHKNMKDLQRIFLLLLGMISILFVVSMYFLIEKGFFSFIDQFIIYNFYYSSSKWIDHVTSLANGVEVLAYSGIFFIGVFSWISICIFLRRSVQKDKHLFLFLLYLLPTELLLSNISGRVEAHYYLAWLPVLAILCGVFYKQIPRILIEKRRRLSDHFKLFFATIFLFSQISFLFLFLFSSVAVDAYQWNISRESIDFIKQKTTTKDVVLVWGSSVNINFLTRTKSPTRYIYQYPLYMQGYQKITMVNEFLNDIIINKPKLIIDTSSSTGIVPPIDANRNKSWHFNHPYHHFHYLSEMDSVKRFILSNYTEIKYLPITGWVVYERNRG